MAFISGRISAGEKTGITTAAVAIALDQPNNQEVLIQSDPANTTNMLIGSAAGQYVKLTPGQAFTLPIFNLSVVYVRMVSGVGVVNWLARE